MSLKQAATDVLTMIEHGQYQTESSSVDFSETHRQSLEATRLYRPDQLDSLRIPSGPATNIRVINATTQVAAHELSDNRLVLLNFASARNTGGGFLNGAKAQEEDLCRCSTLYPTLLTQPDYYETNRREKSTLYTDHIIYSPNVTFFKVRGTGDLLDNPFRASVITAPAPNSRSFLRNSRDVTKLEECFLRRWQNVLAVAADQQAETLLLGAWGCGAFGGDPVLASQTAKQALTEFGAAFPEVVFAIPGKGRQSQANLDAFHAQFVAAQ